jgi:hypothetical protein
MKAEDATMRSKITAITVVVGVLVLLTLNITQWVRIGELNQKVTMLEREAGAAHAYLAEALEIQQNHAALQRRVLDERIGALAARLGVVFEGGQLFPP